METRQAAIERVAFAITSYVRQSHYLKEETIACEDEIKEVVDIDWHGTQLRLPVPLKGFIDRVTRGADGKLRVRDYKTASKFSDLEKIDGGKIIQAVEYFFLAYAKYGEAPYSMTYEEVKTTPNKNPAEPQMREYEIVYAENPLYFDFYFRLMEDFVRAMTGEMVYVPNINAMFDNEVGIIAYIQRLDVEAEAAARKKKLGATTLTEILKADIQQAGNANKLLAAIEGQLTQAKSIDYDHMMNQDKISTKLLEHGMILKFDSLVNGANVDLYRFSSSIGVKMSRLRQYADDIQQVLAVNGVRVLAPIPGTSLVGFEVPTESRRFPAPPPPCGFDLAIGETVDGHVRRFDLRDAPHMLVAGSTGSGKSVFLHGLIRQLKDAGAELLLIDPKQVEFSRYGGGLHDPVEIETTLAYLCDEMDNRYGKLNEAGQRDAREAGWKPKVIVIDEYADLVLNYAKSEIPRLLQRIAQKGRAAGIHLVVATQRASTKVITGDVKVNFPVKAVFRMAKAVDSTVMLDEPGAEKLLGKGDMLFATADGIERLQGYNLA